MAAAVPAAKSTAPAASPAVVAPPAARAAAPPSFTGRWTLDVGASELGKSRRVPRVRVDDIREQGAWIDVRSRMLRGDDADTTRLDYRYRTDGEAVNSVAGQEVRTRGRREGQRVRFDSVAKIMMMEIRQLEVWSLSPDTATFTIERDSQTPLGKEHQRLVFRRGD